MGGKLVKLNKSAFVNILTSCLEVYKKESYGVLMGKAFNGHSVVSQSVNFQSAKRTYDLVDVHPKREKRMIRTLNYLTNHKLVGDFHSHSDYPDRLSKYDKEDLLGKADKWVSMLLVIKNTNKSMPWVYNKQGKHLSGSVSNKYFVKIHAYKNVEGRIMKIPIECNYVDKLNEVHF